MRSEFPYADSRIPAPFVPVVVGSMEADAVVPQTWALVDSGADRTLIPQVMVEHLALTPITELEFEVGGGELITLPIYRVKLTVGDFPPLPVEVAVSGGEENPLLGRDVLNMLTVILYGPKRVLELSDE